MATQYPAQIDDNTSLPQLVDGVTGINASVINRLRDAIVAIEEELGENPATVYTNVRTRLETIEDSIADLDIISLSGDLGNTLSSPQVVGLRGNPISNTPPAAGQFLSFSGLVWAPTTLSYAKLGTGTQQYGVQQLESTVDTKGTFIKVEPKNVQTTNATVTTLDSFTIASNTTLIISAVITAVKSDNTQGAAYIRTAAFRNNGGTVAQIGTTQDDGTLEDDSTWNATIDNSTTTIRIRVTGKAATTIRWTCVTTRLQVIA